MTVFLLLDGPEAYNAPRYPSPALTRMKRSVGTGGAAVAALGIIGAFILGLRK